MNTQTTVTKTQARADYGLYFRISFRGQPRQHALYTRLQDYVHDAIEYLREAGRGAAAQDLVAWMHGSGGFTRPHMPYYVTLTAGEWNILSAGLRRGLHEPTAEYSWVRNHGEWTA